MRPAKVFGLAAALVLGCARPVPSTSTPADANVAADASAPAGEPALVKVAAFDCEKYDLLPGDKPPKGPIAPGAGIRAWRGGGPYGANWNVEELRCATRASTPCTHGKVLFTLRVGPHIVAEREAPVLNGAADFEVVLPLTAWEHSYDSPPKAAAPLKLPYKTVGFRMQAVLDCEAPTKASLRDWNYRFVVADDAFVAGFASGE